MVEWHHQLSGHEFEQTPGDSEGQGSPVCCSLWGHKESNMTVTEQQQQQATLYALFDPVSNPLEVGFWLFLIYK